MSVFVCAANNIVASRQEPGSGRVIEMNAADVPVQNIRRYSIFTVLIHQDKKGFIH